jgi:hypothetical protein
MVLPDFRLIAKQLCQETKQLSHNVMTFETLMGIGRYTIDIAMVLC